MLGVIYENLVLSNSMFCAFIAWRIWWEDRDVNFDEVSVIAFSAPKYTRGTIAPSPLTPSNVLPELIISD